MLYLLDMNRSIKLVKKSSKSIVIVFVVLNAFMIIFSFCVSLLCSFFQSNCFQDMSNIVDSRFQVGTLILSVLIGIITAFILMWIEDYKQH